MSLTKLQPKIWLLAEEKGCDTRTLPALPSKRSPNPSTACLSVPRLQCYIFNIFATSCPHSLTALALNEWCHIQENPRAPSSSTAFPRTTLSHRKHGQTREVWQPSTCKAPAEHRKLSNCQKARRLHLGGCRRPRCLPPPRIRLPGYDCCYSSGNNRQAV